MKLRHSAASLPLTLGLVFSLCFASFSAHAAEDGAETPTFLPGTKEPYPGSFKQAFGIDTVGSTTGLAAGAALNYSRWVGPRLGYEMQVFFFKSPNAATETTSNSQSALGTKSLTTTTSYSGANQPMYFSPAFGFKYRAYQDRWLQVATSFMLFTTFTTSTESPYTAGSRSVVTPDSTAPTTYTTSETNIGTVKSETDLTVGFGPKLSTQFYLPWFPHLALGLSAGVLLGFGGSTKATTTARSRTVATTSGTDAAPSTDTTTTSVAQSSAGLRGTSFGVGGSSFSLFSTSFTLHYEW